MVKRYSVLSKGYTAQEIREYEKQCVIPTPMNLPPFEEWSPIEDMIRDLNTGYKNIVRLLVHILKRKGKMKKKHKKVYVVLRKRKLYYNRPILTCNGGE